MTPTDFKHHQQTPLTKPDQVTSKKTDTHPGEPAAPDPTQASSTETDQSDHDTHQQHRRRKHRRDASRGVPWSLRLAAAWAWRVALVAGATAGVIWVVMHLQVIVLPVAIALLLTVLVEPVVCFFHKKLHVPQTPAAALGLVVSIGALVAIVAKVVDSMYQQFPALLSRASDGLFELTGWLSEGPLKMDAKSTNDTVKQILDQVTTWAQDNSSMLASGVLSVTTSLATLVAGSLIALFCLFFFLKEGRSIWIWFVRQFPQAAREPVHETAIRGWSTLNSYVRTQIKVAAIDAIFIGLGAVILGVPMALPITVVVFFGAFIPIVGALASGAIAVLVALVDQGLTAGVLMLVIILVVQQIEGNLLQPWLMSDAMSLHPIAVLLVVTAAGTLAGIPGAVFGVPIAAFINTAFLYLHGHDPLPHLATKQDRPGGAPGTLDQLVADSYKKPQKERKPVRLKKAN